MTKVTRYFYVFSKWEEIHVWQTAEKGKEKDVHTMYTRSTRRPRKQAALKFASLRNHDYSCHQIWILKKVDDDHNTLLFGTHLSAKAGRNEEKLYPGENHLEWHNDTIG